MPTFDSSRFVYALAGRLLAGDWHIKGLRLKLGRALSEYAVRAPGLVERTVNNFAAKPGYRELVQFLQEDAGFARTMGRLTSAWHRARQPNGPAVMDPLPGLLNLPIPTLINEPDLARWLGLSVGQLHWLADLAGRNRRHPVGPMRTYRYRWVPRRGGFHRLLEIPRYRLSVVQRQVHAEILSVIPAHPSVHGFCTGRSIVTNALAHCGKPIVLKLDLTDFFPSISSARVFRIFRTVGYPPRVARLLTGLCTTSLPADVWDARPVAQTGGDFHRRQALITRHLPQGAPTSPALANLAALRMDRRLAALATTLGANYTRYADDLTFSGGTDLAPGKLRLQTLVAVIAAEEGFALNFRKTRVMRPGTCQSVCGVVVNHRPNIRRESFDQIKAILTNCIRRGPASQNRQSLPDFRAHLTGRIAHVASIHPARGDKLKAQLAKIVWE